MSAVLTPLPVSQLGNADMQAAAERDSAAQRIHETAARAGTPLTVAKDGKLIEEVVQLQQSKTGKD
jgi:hypothetical protein